MSLKSNVENDKSYMNLSYDHELYILPNAKVSTAKDHGKNFIRVEPPRVCHSLDSCLFYKFVMTLLQTKNSIQIRPLLHPVENSAGGGLIQFWELLP